MTDRDLLNKLHGKPFQPFRVRLSNNSKDDVLDSTVALSHMVEFTDIDPPKSDSKRKRAS